MRLLAGIAFAVSACFRTSPPAGVPCDPAAPVCPDGQACEAAGGGFVCGGGALAIDAADPPDSPVTGDAPIDAPTVTHFEYPADVAECLDPQIPSSTPVFCRTQNGAKQMVVDIKDATTDDPWHAYIRFVLDDAFAGKTITSVVLRVKTTDDSLAPGDSGEVSAVAPFVRDDLDTGAPARMGNVLSPSKGNVAELTTVDFALPNDSITAGQPAHFGIFPVGGSGVNYWNIDGDDPPLLVIDTE